MEAEKPTITVKANKGHHKNLIGSIGLFNST